MHIRVNDIVEVIAGDDKGKRGKVLRVLREKKRVVVENVNMVKRHTKPRPIQSRSGMTPQIRPGGVIEKAAPVSVSNVMIVCPTCGRPTRIGMKEKAVKGGTIRVRVCRRADCGEELDR